MKYVIVGGVAGGATAATRLRRLDEKAEIVILERGNHVSFANCGLPYYIGGVIPQRTSLLLQSPKSFASRYNIDVRLQQEVTDINCTGKNITILTPDGKTYTEAYDKLLLSPGAAPIRPNIKGIDLEGVFTLRTVEDSDKIKTYCENHSPKHVIIVGAGFIGLEMAENFHALGMEVTIIDKQKQILPYLDYPMVMPLQMEMKKQGVTLKLGRTVDSIENNPQGGLQLHCAKGETFDTDLIILSVGVKPETALAKKGNLKIGTKGGIWVNEYLQTSCQDIYAVGDAIEFPHPITGEPWLCNLAGPANRQARLVADNMALGNVQKYEGAIGTAIAKVFGKVAATTGLSEDLLKASGIEYCTSITHSASHAGYYPGGNMLSIKLNFCPQTGKLLGAQCVGGEGTDKRIDELALFIKLGATVEQLTQLEHAYAPPFSSAKDPVAMAGYVALNIVNGFVKHTLWSDLEYEKPFVLDVRTNDEFEHGAYPGAVNIPLDELRSRISELPNDKPIAIHCAVGMRGYLATRILMGNGFNNVYNVSGGYRTYSALQKGKTE